MSKTKPKASLKDKGVNDLLKTAFKLPYSEKIEIPNFNLEKPYKESPISIELEPMGIESEILFLQKLQDITLEIFKDYEPEQSNEALSMTSVLMGLKDLLSGVCHFRWLIRVTELTSIILMNYLDGNLTAKTVKKLSLPKHLEIIYLQIETDRGSSEIAQDFFKQIVSKVPTLDVAMQITRIMMQAMQDYQSSGNVAPLPESSDVAPEKSPETTQEGN